MSDYTILQCEKLHDLGYTWIIFPEHYTIAYDGEIIADVKRPFFPLYDSKRIQRELNENLQAVIEFCTNHLA